MPDVEIEKTETEVEEIEARDDFDFIDDFDVFSSEEQIQEDVKAVDEEQAATVEKTEAEVDTEKQVDEKDPVKIIEALNQTLAEERAKKQAAREELRRLQAPEKPVEQKKFDWENPDATIAELKTGFKNEIQTVKLDLSESQAIARHDDYSEKYLVFSEMAQKNPAYIAEMLKQADPAEWAYQQAKKQESLSEIGDDPAAYKAQLKESLKAEIMAELKADGLETQIKKAATILPPSANAIKGKTVKDGEIVISNDPIGDMWGEDR